MRCPFCHNFELVENAEENDELFSPDEVMDYLIKRKGVLDGVTITGGEPTIQKNLENFIKEIKTKTNLLIKLDTNGLNPDKLQDLINKKVLNYVAMDIKNDFDHYSDITGLKNIDVSKIRKSINILKNSGIAHEFRTTVIKNYHTQKNIENILKTIGDSSNYYIQQFIMSENVPNKNLSAYTDKELQEMVNNISKEYPNIKIRGIKS